MEEKRALLHKILDLVLDINGDGVRDREITGDKPTAFLHYLGNAHMLDVDIDIHGWEPGINHDIGEQIRLYRIDAPQRLEQIINELETVLREVSKDGTHTRI